MTDTDTDAPETMLHAYNKSLDWLQWGDEFDDESAACTLIYMDWQRERIKKLERVAQSAHTVFTRWVNKQSNFSIFMSALKKDLAELGGESDN